MTMDPKKILIAEDNADLRESLVDHLEKLGYQVEAVADGAQAIETLGRHRFDLLLTDIRMPNKTGLDVLGWVARQKIKGNAVPKVVVMTGLLEEGESYLKSLGATAVLQKAADFSSFAKVLKQAIEN